MGGPETVARLPGGQRDACLHDPRLAAGQRPDASGVDRLAGRVQRAAGRCAGHRSRAAGRLRGPLSPARRPGVGRRLLRRPGAAPGGADPRRVHPCGRKSRVARGAHAGLPDGRHDHRGQRVTPQRRCGGPAHRRRERRDRHRPAGPVRRSRCGRSRAATVRRRSGRGRRARAGHGRDRLVRPGCRGAERGVRGPVAGVPRRVEDRPRDRQHPRRGDRDRPSARRLGCTRAEHPRAVLVERRERWGLAAICIGVGQGLAVVLENVTG